MCEMWTNFPHWEGKEVTAPWVAFQGWSQWSAVVVGVGGCGVYMCALTSYGMYSQHLGTNSEHEFGGICSH